MIATKELIRWAQTLDPEGSVAIDDGGLTLKEIESGNVETGAYLEVGGIPLDEDLEEEDYEHYDDEWDGSR